MMQKDLFHFADNDLKFEKKFHPVRYGWSQREIIFNFEKENL